MSTLRGNTATATQARDLYNLIAPLLTSNGWTHVNAGTPVVIHNNIEWHVWRNPPANSGAPTEFHVAIGFAQSGTGSIFFRMFENWIGTNPSPSGYYVDPAATPGHGYGCARPVCAEANVTTPGGLGPGQPDVYGLQMYFAVSTSNNAFCWAQPHTPIVRHDPNDPTTPPDFSGCNDFSIALHVGNRAFGSDNTNLWTDVMVDRMLQIQANGPLVFDFRSKYLYQIQLRADDETATEYVIHVSNKWLSMHTRRIFNNDLDAIYLGAYEFAPPHDPAPFVMFRGMHSPSGFTGSFTRVYKFTDDQPAPWAEVYNGEIHASAGSYALRGPWTMDNPLTHYTTKDYQPSTNAPTNSGHLSLHYKGPLTSRVQVLDEDNHLRGLLPESVMISETPSATENPPVEFGDEATINGQDYIFVGVQGTSPETVRKVQDVSQVGSYQTANSYWVIKD